MLRALAEDNQKLVSRVGRHIRPALNTWQRLTGVTPVRSRPAHARNMTQLASANILTAVGLAAGISGNHSFVGWPEFGSAERAMPRRRAHSQTPAAVSSISRVPGSITSPFP